MNDENPWIQHQPHQLIVDPLIGRFYSAGSGYQAGQDFPHPFQIIGETTACFRLKSTVEEYVLSKNRIRQALADGRITEVDPWVG